jgi:hypothetical protein
MATFEIKDALEAKLLLEALSSYYDTAKEMYADGSGMASPEQEAVAELIDRAYALQPAQVQDEHKQLSRDLEDAIAENLNDTGATSVSWDDGSKLEWDQQGRVKRP